MLLLPTGCEPFVCLLVFMLYCSVRVLVNTVFVLDLMCGTFRFCLGVIGVMC